MFWKADFCRYATIYGDSSIRCASVYFSCPGIQEFHIVDLLQVFFLVGAFYPLEFGRRLALEFPAYTDEYAFIDAGSRKLDGELSMIFSMMEVWIGENAIAIGQMCPFWE